jgi:hypothetical protein
LTRDRVKLEAEEIKRRLRLLKKESALLEPKLAVRIDEITEALSIYKSLLLNQKSALIAVLNEIYYDARAYLDGVKLQNTIEQDPTQTHFSRTISLTERYWYSVIFPAWFRERDSKIATWLWKLIEGELEAEDQLFISALQANLDARPNVNASYRYILDLSMATDLLVADASCNFSPLFVQLTTTSIFKDAQLNLDFVSKQQKWEKTCRYWKLERTLLVSCRDQTNAPEYLAQLADVIIKENLERPTVFIDRISFQVEL